MPTEIEVIRAALKANPGGHAILRRMALAGKIRPATAIDPTEPLIVVSTTDHYGITGCIQVKCECGAFVWLSPSTQAMIKERDATPMSKTTIICPLCFEKTMKERREEERTQ